MKKNLLAALFLLLLICPAISAVAAGDRPRIVDLADLLSEKEERELSGALDEISERQQTDVVIVTVNSLGGISGTAYADDFFDYNGYGIGDNRDGILFLLSMEERKWYISTRGYGITAFTDAGQEYLSEQMLGDLSIGEYAAAFRTFARLCDDFLTQAASGDPYDIDNLPKGKFPVITMLLFDLALAFIIALVVTGVMRLQLRNVGKASAADPYMEKESMQLTQETDLFLYRHVERREKQKVKEEEEQKDDTGKTGGSTTHQSSSGATHGGSSGKF